MQMIVEPLHLGQQHAQEFRARRNDAIRRGFDRLAISERMRHAADARDALGQHDAARGLEALEPLLHAAMLEEQPRMIVQDRFADVEEQKLAGFDHVGAHRAERQQLHVGLGAGDFRNRLLRRFHAQRKVGRIVGIERRFARLGALVQHQPMRLRVVEKAQAEQIGDLALVPAQQRRYAGETRNRLARVAAPDRERRRAGGACGVAQLEPIRLGIPGIGHLHAPAGGEQIGGGIFQLRRTQRCCLRQGHGVGPVRTWAAAMK